MAKKFQLKNGLNVLMIESHKSPVISIQMWVNTGSADEQKGEEGISHFIEHLVFKGTDKFGVGEIASKVEGDGGQLNAYTSFDQTVFFITMSKKYASTGLDCISQMMGYPTFDENEIDNEREVVIEEIKRSMDSPHRQASRQLFETIYKKHPYGIPVIGYVDNIRRVTKEEITDYFQRRYVPENMTLLVVGDFNSKNMKEEIKKYFQNFKKRPIKKIKREKEPTQLRKRITVKKASFEETLLNLAWRVPKGTHADIPALDALAFILGQGDSSRLMKATRIDNAITNYTTSGTYTPKDEGFFAISSSINAKNLELALEEILKQIESIFVNPPSNDEIKKAIVNFESDNYYAMESVDGMASIYGSFENLFGDYNKIEEFMEKVEKLTAKDILRVAKKYLKPETLTATVLSSENEDELKQKIQKWTVKYNKFYKNLKLKTVTDSQKEKRKPYKWKSKSENKKSEIKKVKLLNGSTVILKQSNDAPIVSLKTAFLGGLRVESKEQSGVNELLSRCWVSDTKNDTEENLFRKIESYASRLNAFTGRNTAGVNMTSLTPYLKETFSLFKDVLCTPVFKESTIEREKHYMLEALKNREDNGAQIAVLDFYNKIFEGHPYSKDPLGKKETILKLGKKELEDHYHSMISTKNMFFSVVGNFKNDKWIKEIEVATKNLPLGNKYEIKSNFKPIEKDVFTFKKKKKEQSHIIIGMIVLIGDWALELILILQVKQKNQVLVFAFGTLQI